MEGCDAKPGDSAWLASWPHLRGSGLSVSRSFGASDCPSARRNNSDDRVEPKSANFPHATRLLQIVQSSRKCITHTACFHMQPQTLIVPSGRVQSLDERGAFDL